jgi:hypothetical protein
MQCKVNQRDGKEPCILNTKTLWKWLTLRFGRLTAPVIAPKIIEYMGVVGPDYQFLMDVKERTDLSLATNP